MASTSTPLAPFVVGTDSFQGFQLKIFEHKSAKYSPRTHANASRAELTVAFAMDFKTAGEKCTHKAAGNAYTGLYMADDWLINARVLFLGCRRLNVRTLNVAGNGIYTLKLYGMTQCEVNRYVYDVIAKVHEYWPLEMIVSGGQTGVDLAGGVAAEMLGIPCEMTLPKGFIQRGEDGKDATHTEQEILTQVAYWKGVLSREIYEDDVPQ